MPRFIPIIDLFAGPGGLGEGFSNAGFSVGLSIEKDRAAWLTLRFRALCRLVLAADGPDAITAALRAPDPQANLETRFHEFAERAEEEAWCATLGEEPSVLVGTRIEKALSGTEDWVLLGGPPCQAYSLVGRSRMRPTRPDFEDDHRHFLYREYLRIVADHAPPVFLMENVKGLLSARNRGARMIHRIIEDLQLPRRAIRSSPVRLRGVNIEYDIVPVVRAFTLLDDGPHAPQEFVVRAEEHGIPQARHRLFLLGLRRDRNLRGRWKGIEPLTPVTVEDALLDLPRIRSGVSGNGIHPWAAHIRDSLSEPWFQELRRLDPAVARALRDAASDIEPALDCGGNVIPRDRRRKPRILRRWYRFDSLPYVLNHEARAHMVSDLHRYLFAASFAEVHGKSPHLADFPTSLLPRHRNVLEASGEPIFDDRFRVQCWKAAASTVMSHISKDGHYYIHPDTAQCRSLTVREAARLQTFPDDYFFCGPRTEQYHQVGNAVPPYLAFQIAKAIKRSFF